MKTKQEIVQDLLDRSEESLIKIDIRMGFLQNKNAAGGHKHYMEEMMQLTGDKKETEEWIEYLKSQLSK